MLALKHNYCQKYCHAKKVHMQIPYKHHRQASHHPLMLNTSTFTDSSHMKYTAACLIVMTLLKNKNTDALVYMHVSVQYNPLTTMVWTLSSLLFFFFGMNTYCCREVWKKNCKMEALISRAFTGMSQSWCSAYSVRSSTSMVLFFYCKQAGVPV